MTAEANPWYRVTLAAVSLLCYCWFLTLATQQSRGTGGYTTADALAALPPVLPFAVVSLVLLFSLFRKHVQATTAAKCVAGVLLAIFAAYSALLWVSWGRF